MNRKLGVDDHITNEDGDRMQEPSVQPDDQHRRNVHLKQQRRHEQGRLSLLRHAV